MNDGFVQAPRGEAGEMLIRRNYHAFILLYFISQRARRTPDPINGLEIGEAMMGDFETYGMSKQNYRTAKAILEECNLVTLKPTPKGTIIKIIDTSIFDININESNEQTNTQLTHDQHTANTQLTPNKNVNKEKNDKNEKEITTSFELFWKVYPRKTAKSTCLKKWLVIQPDAELSQTITDAVTKQIAAGMLNAVDLQYCPLPMTWLNQKRWEDPIVTINRGERGHNSEHDYLVAQAKKVAQDGRPFPEGQDVTKGWDSDDE